MPLKTKRRRLSSATASSTQSRSSTSTLPQQAHVAFIPLLAVCFIFWVIYRLIFTFPVAFDETIGKALFFGLPVWLYVSMTGSRIIPDTFDLIKLRRGLLLGIAFGGIFGFASVLLKLWQGDQVVVAAPLFTAPLFWGEFILAIMTGFWETLFFFSWIYTVIDQKWFKWPLLQKVVLCAGIFVLFHLPNTVLRLEGSMGLAQLLLLFLFAMGQALLFHQHRNGYALVLSHAIWGLILLLHF
ncbi:MAG: hypothetical protein M3Q81_03270 [bacterium]|nr:hypothetical protein [bacterium]